MGRLTDQKVKAATASGKFDTWLADDDARGSGRLVLRVKAGGAKAFYYRYTTHDGHRRTYRIGPYNAHGDGKVGFTLAQARERRAELVKIHRETGGDVHAYLEAKQRTEARQRRAEAEAEAKAERLGRAQSFGALLEFYITHLEREKRLSAADVRRALKRHVFDVPDLADLCGKRAADITRDEIKGIVERLVDAGKKRQADKVRAYIRAAYSLGIDAGERFCLNASPAASVKRIRGASQPGTRTLSEGELRAFWQELEAEAPMQRDALRLAIVLGGQRFAQLTRLKPHDVDLAVDQLLLEDPKGRREKPRQHLLPLTEMAKGILTSALAVNGRAKYVLSSTGERPIHDSTLSGLVHSVAKRMVGAGTARSMFRGGDLRRTCETMLARINVSKDIRAQIQSHGLGGVQAFHYDRHDYFEEKAAALANWERKLLAILRGEEGPGARVIRINRSA